MSDDADVSRETNVTDECVWTSTTWGTNPGLCKTHHRCYPCKTDKKSRS